MALNHAKPGEVIDVNPYLKHIHVGPYQPLPQKWRALRTELAARGEPIGSPSLEIYRHHCEDPSEAETTILIGLQPTMVSA